MLEASEALLDFDVPVPPEDPTLALLATVVDDLLGLTEVLVEEPEDLLTEVATAEVVVLLAVVNVAVLEAVAMEADFAAAAAAAFAAAALAAACCAAVKVVVAAAEKLAAPVMATNKQMTNELGINFIMTPSAD